MQYVTLRRRTGATGSNAPSPYMPTASSPTTQSIIMSDGNICDPIRHMGC